MGEGRDLTHQSLVHLRHANNWFAPCCGIVAVVTKPFKCQGYPRLDDIRGYRAAYHDMAFLEETFNLLVGEGRGWVGCGVHCAYLAGAIISFLPGRQSIRFLGHVNPGRARSMRPQGETAYNPQVL